MARLFAIGRHRLIGVLVRDDDRRSVRRRAHRDAMTVTMVIIHWLKNSRLLVVARLDAEARVLDIRRVAIAFLLLVVTRLHLLVVVLLQRSLFFQN